MPEAYIVDAVRTPVGKRGGSRWAAAAQAAAANRQAPTLHTHTSTPLPSQAELCERQTTCGNTHGGHSGRGQSARQWLWMRREQDTWRRE